MNREYVRKALKLLNEAESTHDDITRIIEHFEVAQQYVDGEEIEFFHIKEDQWMDTILSPCFSINTKYRVKPRRQVSISEAQEILDGILKHKVKINEDL